MSQPEDKAVFAKPFTQQEPIPEEAIAKAVEVMRNGRLHRYNTLEGEVAEARAHQRLHAVSRPRCHR